MSSPESIEWQAPEYTFHPKTQNWYWGVALLGLFLAFIALFTLNFLLVFLVIIATGTVMIYGARKPEVVTFAITRKGLRFHNRLYHYDRLKSFWVLDEPAVRKIIIESDRLVLPHLVVPLPDSVNAEAVRQYLSGFLSERRHEESLADVLSDYFGF